MSYISDFFPKIKNYKYGLATVGSTPQLCLDAGALKVNSVRSIFWCKFSLLNQVQYCIEVMHEFSTKVVVSTLFASSHIKLIVKSYSTGLQVKDSANELIGCHKLNYSKLRKIKNTNTIP